MCAWKFNPFTGKLDYYASMSPNEVDFMEYDSDEAAQDAYVSNCLDPVPASIVLDAVSNSGTKANVSTWSWSHTCSGSDRVLVVGISWYMGAPTTSVTYNGVSMTLAVQASYVDVPPDNASIYYLANPDSGSHTVSVAFTSGSYGTAGAISFSSANTSSPIDQTANSSALSTQITTNITTNYNNSYLIDILEGNNTISGGAVNTGQTLEWLLQPPDVASNGCSSKAAGSAGAYSMGWHGFASTMKIAHAVAAIRAATVPALQCYSEGTIKTQGSYSLKVISKVTHSLNKTLTRSVLPTLDLSDKIMVKFDVYASRTGGNIKIGLHNSDDTTTEITPYIASANAFQTITWDFSGVPNSAKNAIDEIIVTIVNADEDNVFYLDNFYAI